MSSIKVETVLSTDRKERSKNAIVKINLLNAYSIHFPMDRIKI